MFSQIDCKKIDKYLRIFQPKEDKGQRKEDTCYGLHCILQQCIITVVA